MAHSKSASCCLADNCKCFCTNPEVMVQNWKEASQCKKNPGIISTQEEILPAWISFSVSPHLSRFRNSSVFPRNCIAQNYTDNEIFILPYCKSPQNIRAWKYTSNMFKPAHQIVLSSKAPVHWQFQPAWNIHVPPSDSNSTFVANFAWNTPPPPVIAQNASSLIVWDDSLLALNPKSEYQL